LAEMDSSRGRSIVGVLGPTSLIGHFHSHNVPHVLEARGTWVRFT